MNSQKHNDFEYYVSAYPDKVKQILKQIREIIKETAPESIGGLSYGMPAFKTI